MEVRLMDLQKRLDFISKKKKKIFEVSEDAANKFDGDKKTATERMNII
jgi:hypothetical protein